MGSRCHGLTLARLVSQAALFLLIIPFVPAARGANSQPGLVKGAIGDSVLVLNGPWRFHPGDNMAWASLNFDDSSWGAVDLTPPEGSYDPITGSSGFVPGWTANGYPRLADYAWYRLRVQLQNQGSATEAPALALAMPLNFDDAYQVYVNGQEIGQFGRFTSHGVTFYNAQPRSFPIPARPQNGVLTIAIRFWMDSGTPLASQDAGGLHGPPLLGESSAIDAMLRLAWDAVNRTQVGNLLSIIFLFLATLLGFTLYWLDRNDPAYLWLGAVCISGLLSRASVWMGYYTVILPMVPEVFIQDVFLSPLTLGLWALFWAYWFKLEDLRKIARISWTLTALLTVGMSTVRTPVLGKVVPVDAAAWLLPVALVLRWDAPGSAAA